MTPRQRLEAQKPAPPHPCCCPAPLWHQQPSQQPCPSLRRLAPIHWHHPLKFDHFTKHQIVFTQTFIKKFFIREEGHLAATCSGKVGLWNEGEGQQQTEQLQRGTGFQWLLSSNLPPNYMFSFQCSNNYNFKYSEFVFMSDSSNDYKWRLYQV